MKTLIFGGKAVTRTHRRIDQACATRLAAEQHLPLTPSVAYDGTVDLWADREVTTLEEVQALKAYTDVTDARLRWHGVPR